MVKRRISQDCDATINNAPSEIQDWRVFIAHYWHFSALGAPPLESCWVSASENVGLRPWSWGVLGLQKRLETSEINLESFSDIGNVKNP